MPSGLSLEDLSFFDTLASSKNPPVGSLPGIRNGHALAVGSSSSNKDLLLDLFASPGQSLNRAPALGSGTNDKPISPSTSLFEALSPTTLTSNFSPVTPIPSGLTSSLQSGPYKPSIPIQPQEDDDFGDFVDSSAPPTLPPKPAEYKSPLNATFSRPATQDTLFLPELQAGVQKGGIASSRPPAKYEIQAQINELGINNDKQSPIRFGQHMAMPSSDTKQSSGGNFSSQKIVTARWKDVISARPGPAANHSKSSSKDQNLLFGPSSNQKTTRPTDNRAGFGSTNKGPMIMDMSKNNGVHRKSNSLFKKPAVTKDLIPDVNTGDEWEAFEDSQPNSANDAAPAKVFVPVEFQGIPDSTILLTKFNETVLHIVDTLFAEIVPLSYSLKKRVLNHTKTKKFLEGFSETVQIGAQIMAGRYRRTGDAQTSTIQASDRAAREFARIWAQEIMPRLRTTLPPGSSSKLCELNPTSTFSSTSNTPHCIVCGLSKTELVQKPPMNTKGAALKRWNDETNLGHINCLKFWSHRSVYGI